jgi:translation initiation factor 1A
VIAVYENKEQNPEGEYRRLRLPNKHKNEMFAIADRLLGGSRMNVICGDGKSRMARIPGRMKRRQRVRAGDLVIIKPWDIQNEKADIIFRYRRTQSVILSRRNLIPEAIDVF